MRTSWMRFSVSALVAAAGSSTALADLSPVIFRIEAENASGTGRVRPPMTWSKLLGGMAR